MSLFDKLKSKTAQRADEPAPDVPYHMNSFSEDARRRTNIFTKMAAQQGLEMLPGRFGGEFNNDMLAVGDKNGQFMMLLGMKISGPDGGIQLDNHSMGGFLQCSSNWLKMVVYSLQLQEDHQGTADKIEHAMASNTLSLAVAYIDMETKQLNAIPVAIQD